MRITSARANYLNERHIVAAEELPLSCHPTGRLYRRAITSHNLKGM